MVKHTQTIRWLLPTNCLILFDHFVGLVLKGLTNAFLKVHKITLIMVLWFIILVNSFVVVVFATIGAKYSRMNQVKYMEDSL